MIRLPRHVRGGIRGQKNGHSCQLVRLSRTAHGDPLAQIFAPRGMLPGHLRQVGQDMTGADRVAADAVLCKLDCHGTVSATTPLFDAP